MVCFSEFALKYSEKPQSPDLTKNKFPGFIPRISRTATTDTSTYMVCLTKRFSYDSAALEQFTRTNQTVL